MERFDVHVGTTDGALQETPEVLKAIGVNLAVNVRLSVIDDVVNVVRAESLIREMRVSVQGRARFNVLPNNGLKMALLAARNDGSADLASAVLAVAIQQADNGHFAEECIAVRTLEDALPFARMHVAR